MGSTPWPNIRPYPLPNLEHADAGEPAPTSMSAVSRYGERAVLIDVAPGAGTAVAAHLRSVLGNDLLDAVPAGHCVLATFASPVSTAAVAQALTTPAPAAAPVLAPRTVVIPVRYDGPDLDEVARLVELTTAEVIEAHTLAEYRVDFFGFAPGFAYLTGLPPLLHLPRRATPRTAVPAGSVAIAAAYAAIYPQSSPGGWHLLGTTHLTMFDPGRPDDPSLVNPGDVVRFECT